MKLDKAIRWLRSYLKWRKLDPDGETLDAIKLGAEALKDKLKARRHGHAYSSKLLPGETED